MWTSLQRTVVLISVTRFALPRKTSPEDHSGMRIITLKTSRKWAVWHGMALADTHGGFSRICWWHLYHHPLTEYLTKAATGKGTQHWLTPLGCGPPWQGSSSTRQLAGHIASADEKQREGRAVLSPLALLTLSRTTHGLVTPTIMAGLH